MRRKTVPQRVQASMLIDCCSFKHLLEVTLYRFSGQGVPCMWVPYN